MRTVALDFDGVICDSAREVFVVAVRCYRSLVPDSRVAGEIHDRLEDGSKLVGNPSTDPAYASFTALTPLGNRAEDFGVALRALDEGLDLPDQQSYDSFYSSLEPEWLQTYHQRFYEHRAALREADPEAWIALHGHWPSFTDCLLRWSGRARIALATAKDGISARLLLSAFGLDSVFPEELLFDKETGVHKTDHLSRLHERTGVPFEEITFVDDKVNHLLRVAGLGVRPVLAEWGFNTPREHAEARRLGFEMASLDTAEAVLFERND